MSGEVCSSPDTCRVALTGERLRRDTELRRSIITEPSSLGSIVSGRAGASSLGSTIGRGRAGDSFVDERLETVIDVTVCASFRERWANSLPRLLVDLVVKIADAEWLLPCLVRGLGGLPPLGHSGSLRHSDTAIFWLWLSVSTHSRSSMKLLALKRTDLAQKQAHIRTQGSGPTQYTISLISLSSRLSSYLPPSRATVIWLSDSSVILVRESIRSEPAGLISPCR